MEVILKDHQEKITRQAVISCLLRVSVLTVCVLFSLDRTATAQWQNVSNALLGAIPNACCGFSNIHFKDGVVWAGATNLFVSRDSGLTWATVPSFNNGRIGEINFYDKNNGVISTLNGVWKTADGGTSWQKILNATSCYASEFAGSVNNIVVSSDGSGAALYYSSDGGMTWQSKNTNLHNLSVLGMADGSAYGFAGSGASGSLFHTVNQGLSWTVVSNIDYDSFSMALDSDGTYTYLMNEEGHIWSDHLASFIRSNDAGATWQKMTSFTPQYYTGGISVQRCAIYCQSLSNGILRSTDKGASWISIGGPNNFIDTRLVCAISNNLVIAADGNGSIWRTTNSGGKSLGGGVPTTSLPPVLSIGGCDADSLTIIIDGIGCESFYLTNAVLLDPDLGAFAMGAVTLPKKLGNGSTDTIRIKLDPRGRSGQLRGQIKLTYDGVNGPVDTLIDLDVSINIDPPKILANPTPVVFGSTSLCAQGVDTIITLYNPGCDTIQIISGVDGLGPGFSADSLSLPIILPPDSSVHIKVHFLPLRPGAYTTNARFVADHYGLRQSISVLLTAQAVGKNGGNPMPQLVNFDTVSICHGFRDTVITLTNPGCDTLWLTKGPIVLGNGFTSDTLPLPFMLPPDSSVRLVFHFQPSNAGSYATSATITIANDSVSEDLAIALQGKGVRGTGTLAVNNDDLNFGRVSLCNPDRDSVIVLVNHSCDTIVINSGTLTTGSGFSVDPIKYPIILPPDSSYLVIIHFHPSSASSYQLSGIVFGTDHGANLRTTFSARGSAYSSGTGPIIQQTALYFGSFTTCDPWQDTTVRFTNYGCDTLFILSGPGTLGNGFTCDGLTFPIVIPPDSFVTITFHFRAPTVGHFTASPHFDTRLGKNSGAVDLSLSGDITPGAATFSLATPSISFDPLSICAEDSADIIYTNTGCDTLFITPEGLLGDSDFDAPYGSEQVVAPGDTIHIRVRLHPRQYGDRHSRYKLGVRSAYTQSVDTSIYIDASILPGTKLITSSLVTVDFDTTTLCASPDTVIVLKNRGCDTLQIYSATFTNSGFSTAGINFPIFLAPGDSTTLKIQTELDTSGTKAHSQSELMVSSNSVVPLAPIELSRSYRYPILCHIHAELNTAIGTSKDTVLMEILIDSVTPGLNRIDAQFHTGNSDLFSFVRSESADSVFLTDTSISILGSPIIAPGGVLATLYYSVYLTTDSVADIGLSDVKLNGFDPAYQECVALAEGVGTRFDYQYYCGQHILADYLRGHLDLRLNSIKPNPTTDRLTIDLSSERNGVVDIDVIDVIGKLVVRERHLLHRGDQTISVNTRSLPSGSYLLQLNTYGSTIRREFLKLR